MHNSHEKMYMQWPWWCARLEVSLSVLITSQWCTLPGGTALSTVHLSVVYTFWGYSSQHCTPLSGVHSQEVQLSALYTSQWCTLPGGTALGTVHLSVVYTSLGYSYQYCTPPSGVHSVVYIYSTAYSVHNWDMYGEELCTSPGVYTTLMCTVLICTHHTVRASLVGYSFDSCIPSGCVQLWEMDSTESCTSI